MLYIIVFSLLKGCLSTNMSQGLTYALSAFKAYDIRGQVPKELDEKVAQRLGMAFAQVTGAKRVAVGYDIRLSSSSLAAAVCRGLNAWGVEVTNIGLCGTEEIYYACGALGFDGGLMITASHNPKEYNGIKMVLGGARPLCQENGLAEIRRLVTQDWNFTEEIKGLSLTTPGHTVTKEIHNSFIDFVLNLVNLETIKKANLSVVVNCGNGGAGVIVKRLAEKLPLKLHIINGEPDGHFPNGIPNPLLPENRQSTAEAVKKYKANLGVAWDGDFDRCFFFDEKGQFIEGYYLVGLFADRFLQLNPGATIIHDPRLYWNTQEIILQNGGRPIMSKTGHAFIKQAMRKYDSVYGGEMSAHQYFKDFFYCDGGILPWLMLMEYMGQRSQTLSQLIGDRMDRYPVSGEVNFHINCQPEVIFAELKERLATDYGPALAEDHLDGLSLEYGKFRLNLRASNTEPLLRLNVETRADKGLVNIISKLVSDVVAEVCNKNYGHYVDLGS